MRVSLDYHRLAETCDLLVDSLRQKHYPYDIATRPQDFVSSSWKQDSRAFANLFVGVCHLMRGTVQSDYAIRQIDKLCLKHPELNDPEFLSRHDVDVTYVYERMKPFLQYRLFEIPRLWLENYRRLQSHWGGDARNIFRGVSDSAELYRRIINIESLPKAKRAPDKLPGLVGFRTKMANMLAYFLMDTGLIEEFKTSTPFDFHNARALIATGALTLKTRPVRYEDVEVIGHAAIERYAKERSVTTVELGDALWCLSTTACRNAPGNRTLGRLKEDPEKAKRRHAIDYQPQERKESTLSMYVPDWSNQADVDEHEQSCARCPLGKSGMCTMNVSAGFYYERGEFVTQPRTEPLPGLFNGSLPHFSVSAKLASEPKKTEVTPVPLLPGKWPIMNRPEPEVPAEH